eukprot:scaffold352019_cov33-Prasinocladus_malaysianus.AAC.1
MGRFCLAVIMSRTFLRQKKKRPQRPNLGRRKRLATMQYKSCVPPLMNFRLELTILWLVYPSIAKPETVLSINNTEQYERDGR